MTQQQTTIVPRINARAVAQPIFNEIYSEGYQLKYKDTPRKEFIHRAMAEAGMTEKGAASYHQNFKNVAAGKPLYYAPKKKAAQTFVDVSAAIATPEQPEAEQPEAAVEAKPKRRRAAKKETA